MVRSQKGRQLRKHFLIFLFNLGGYSLSLPTHIFYFTLLFSETSSPNRITPSYPTLNLIPIPVVGILEILCSQRTVTGFMGLTKGLMAFVVSSPEYSNSSNSGPWDRMQQFDTWDRARYFLRDEILLLLREGDPGVRGILAFGRQTNNWLINGQGLGNSY